MLSDVNLWPLIGVAIIIVGFVLRFNPMLVVIVTAVGTALAAGFPIDKILATIGTGFIKTRNLPLIILLPLAVIGLLERHGLRQHAQNWISSIKSATAGRLLIVYLAARQLTAAIGLTSLGGHPQMVRPLLAPMATLHIQGGRKEKIRAGDVLGALTADLGYTREQVGKISINDWSTYVALERSVAAEAARRLAGTRIKGRSVKVRLIGDLEVSDNAGP